MERFTKAIRQSLETQNWYAALILALTMPDICGRIEFPNLSTEKRYVGWWDAYLLDKYSRPSVDAQDRHIFLQGRDVYALRCAYLHEGRSSIENQRAKKALNDFIFISPSPEMHIHCNHFNDSLQLQVDCFCEDVTQGVEQWMENIDYSNRAINDQYKLLSIEPSLTFFT